MAGRIAGQARRYIDPRKKNQALRNRLRARIFSQADNCAICGFAVDKTLGPYLPESPELDEKIPVARGGDPYDINNLQLTHRKCNRAKSDKMPMHLVVQKVEQIPHSNRW